MKYLKKYQIFENFKFEDLKEDLKDILLEVEDLDLKVEINKEYHHAFESALNILIYKSNYNGTLNYFEYDLDELDVFKIGIVEEFIVRINDYLLELDWVRYQNSIITIDNLSNNSVSGNWKSAIKTDITIKEDSIFYKTKGNNGNPDANSLGLLNVKVPSNTLVNCIRLGYGSDQ